MFIVPKPVEIIGVLNVTPDSYYDGGRYVEVEGAVKRAGEMLTEGADWIEVGGESTGPGSRDVPLEEELRRTIPVVEALRKAYTEAKISIDTYKSQVAQQALEAGATMVNDVTAGRADPRMFSVLANYKALAVLMYAKDPTPRTTVQPVQYEDVVEAIKKFLRARKNAALKVGVPADRIILDPGLGHFISSDPQYSFEILARLPEFQELGCPLLLSPSRKSFLAGSENLQPSDRLPGTITASAVATLHGATYIRTHDVLPIRRACEIAAMIKKRFRTLRR